MLEIKNLHVSVENKQIVKGLDITIKKGEVHVLMGPNGSGKSTLAMAVMGHPKYKIDKGDITLGGKSIKDMPANERAKKGLFLSFQYPAEVPGVGMMNFLRMASSNSAKPLCEFRDDVKQKMSVLGMNGFEKRSLNEGFSGGEKKRSEMLQMLLLQPAIAILDEIDSGLDVDGLDTIAKTVNDMKDAGVLIITHYNRMLEYINPDYVHVMVDGKIVKSGGAQLAKELDEKGYENFQAR